jgi:GH24 family phage-related lysozyme (muramidase)
VDMDALLQQLLHDEGLKTHVYRDSRGHLTVGSGHLVTPQDHLGPHATITHKQAYALLAEDIGKAITACEHLWPHFHAMPEEAQRVLVQAAFILGENKLKRFVHLHQAIEQARWEAAARALEKSKVFTQIGTRAQRLVARLRALGGAR